MAAPPPMAGFVTPMPPQMGPPMNMPHKHPSDGPSEDEPTNKKMRNEDSLIPEEVFLTRNPVSGFFTVIESYTNLTCFLEPS